METPSDNGNLVLTVLGSGTSAGVPTIGCKCHVCHSEDPRDNRLRPSVFVRFAGRVIVIDTGPDFRAQALRYGVDRLDAVLYTHAHADHILGLDDTRPFNFRQGGAIPIYGSEHTINTIQRVFSYIFSNDEHESWVPQIQAHTVEPLQTLSLFGREIQAIPLRHGRNLVTFGYRFGPLAYLTDHNEIPDESLEQLQGLDTLFLDALRHKPHPTHSNVQKSLNYVEQLKPRQAFFTHISHDLPHGRTEELLPPHVRLAYDGMQVRVEAARCV